MTAAAGGAHASAAAQRAPAAGGGAHVSVAAQEAAKVPLLPVVPVEGYVPVPSTGEWVGGWVCGCVGVRVCGCTSVAGCARGGLRPSSFHRGVCEYVRVCVCARARWKVCVR